MYQNNSKNLQFENGYFKFPYPNNSENGRATFYHFFNEFKKIQDKLFLKCPYSSIFKLAKISEIVREQEHLLISYNYESLSNETITINLVQDSIEDGFNQGYKLIEVYKEESKFDFASLKSIVQCFIEIFHWSANFGLHLDPYEELFLVSTQDHDIFILLPCFQLITKYIFNKESPEFSMRVFLQYRTSTYQNATYFFIKNFVSQFFQQLKTQDDDRQQYKEFFENNQNYDIDKILEFKENLQGVDYLYSKESVKRKMWKQSFKQTMLLYQLSCNENLRKLFLQYKEQDQSIVQNKLQGTQSNNLKEFVGKINISGTNSFDVLTSFAEKMKDKLDTNNNMFIQEQFIPHWKKYYHNHEMKLNPVTKEDDQQNICEYSWNSDINDQNIIYSLINQSAQIKGNLKTLSIKYKFELLESKQCFIFRTHIPEILFSIDTADDIMFLVNIIQKEMGATNLYVDDNRRLTLYTSIVMGQKVEIIAAVLKIIDIHQIYFYLILEFYAKNIQYGRSIKEQRYQSFVKELAHYIWDYENDFEKQLKNIQNEQIQIGF